MKFIDEIKIKLIAGKGGDGAISFRREFKVNRGGPDGGNGGKGGSIYLCGDKGTNTLFHLKRSKIIRGVDGENGAAKNCYGIKGQDTFIKVPLGTLVYEDDNLILDVVEEKKYLIAQGGNGGRGNTSFKSSKNKVPRLSEKGELGQKLNVTLSLQLLADIGFVGKPSAGKSTILAKITNAKPKIADYEFTTLVPQLGVSEIDGHSFVVSDLPGLIKGASQGKGLGQDFLKHIARCKVIAHIVDFGSEQKNPIDDYEIINHELHSYELDLLKKTQLVIANKSDLPAFENNWNEFKKAFPDVSIVPISALNETNLRELKFKLWDTLINAKIVEYEKPTSEVTISLQEDIIVEKKFAGYYELSGLIVEKIYNKIPLNTLDNWRRFNQLMKEAGVWKKLEDSGIKEGDTVAIESYKFVWSYDNF